MTQQAPPECPHSKQQKTAPATEDTCPVEHHQSKKSDGCPVDHGESNGSGELYDGNIFTRIHKALYGDTTESGTLSRRAPIPTTTEVRNPSTNDIVFGQSQQPDQKSHLSTQRIISTIPKVRHIQHTVHLRKRFRVTSRHHISQAIFLSGCTPPSNSTIMP